MKQTRSLATAALGAALALGTVVGTASDATARPDGDIAPAGAPARAPAEQADEAGQYVISFAPGKRAEALAAAERAGGTVVDVQDEVGLALVDTGSTTFASKARASSSIGGVVHNQSIGANRKGMPRVTATDRLTATDDAATSKRPHKKKPSRNRGDDPFESLQWDNKMMGATRDGAHRTTTGRGTTVGIIDTGVDASHPDISPNFSYRLSRNFTHDIPAIDGPCDTPTCIDPAWVDEGGHGTHVAGTVAAARNGVGIAGVAPDAKIVNVRAGQDSGYFFFYETVSALLYAGDAGLDVVNMSFYVDPWLWNCASAEDYVSGEFTQEQIDEQAMIRTAVIAALEDAHENDVTLVASAGNSFTNLALPTRTDGSSPDYPPGTEADRVVTENCLDLPAEGPNVLTVGSVGPSGTKADYSSYGNPDVEITAPGGWFRDGIGTPTFRTSANMILSSYPFDLAVEEGYLEEDGTPTADDALSDCDDDGNCAAWIYIQGTSMASPHVTGEAALVIDAHGKGRRNHISPHEVNRIIMDSATDHRCPAGGVEIYTDEGRGPEYNAVCEGTTARNGLYGEGIVNAAQAVKKQHRHH